MPLHIFNHDIKASDLIKSWLVHSIFWSFIALLVFIQDYIESSINNFNYFISESLIFKTFWILFIPISIVWFRTIDWLQIKLAYRFNDVIWLLIFLLSIFFSVSHLSLFAILLKALNFLIHDEDWILSWILKDVISERFYFPIATYLGLGYLYVWFKQGESIKKIRKTIKVKHGTKSQLVNIEEVEYVSIENSVTRVVTKSQKHIYQGSLKQIEKSLDSIMFKRIHRSKIINIQAVQQLNSRQNGDYDVLMKSGTILRLSRRYVNEVRGSLL